MAAVDDLDQVIEQYQRAANEFLKGNPEPHKMMFSHREDATLLNPLVLSTMDSSRSLREWSVSHCRSAMARSLASML